MMHTQNRSTVVGVFHDASRAQEAVRALREAGFSDDQIGMITREGKVRDRTSSDAAAVVAGAAVGTATSAAEIAALWSLGISFGLLPIIGPVVAAGPLAAALISAVGGAAVGAAAGGLVGALVSLGLTEPDARFYENEVQAGRTLVTVAAGSRANEAWAILHRLGAQDRQPAAVVEAEAEVTPEVEEVLEVQAVEVPVGPEDVIGDHDMSARPAVTEIRVPVTQEDLSAEKAPGTGRM